MLGGNFRRLLAASAMSNLADGVYQFTIPLVALTLTRDPTAFATVSLVARLPWLLFSLVAGALADRLDRRRTMVFVNTGRALALAALTMVVAAGAAELWILYVIAFTLGIGETLFDTAAQSIVPNLVEPDQLARANSRQQAAEITANQFIGPPLGTFVAGATLAGALGSSAVLFLAAAVALSMLRGNFRSQRTSRPALLADVREGVGYLARHRVLRVLAVCVGMSNMSSMAFTAVAPLYAIAPGPVGLSERWYGLLMTAFAAGAVVGTAFVERLHDRVGARPLLLVATAAFPLMPLAPAITTSPWAIGAIFFASGTLSIAWNILTVSFRQRVVPDHLLGRVNAGYRLVAWGTLPIGAAMGGLTADIVGLRASFVVFAALGAICFLILLISPSTRGDFTSARSSGNEAETFPGHSAADSRTT